MSGTERALGAPLSWLIAGVATGVLAALRRGTLVDRAAMGIALGGVSSEGDTIAVWTRPRRASSATRARQRRGANGSANNRTTPSIAVYRPATRSTGL